MAHWNAWWWTPDEWQAEADRQQPPQGGGGGGGGVGATGFMYAAADPSTDQTELPTTRPA